MIWIAVGVAAAITGWWCFCEWWVKSMTRRWDNHLAILREVRKDIAKRRERLKDNEWWLQN